MNIKIRAWCLNSRQYSYCDRIYLQDGLTLQDLFDDPEQIFELYTGLKDSNGVEIYGGDKCEITFEDGQKDVMTVVFDRACFHLKGNGFWSLNNTQNIKVIGNIHANPELLEAE